MDRGARKAGPALAPWSTSGVSRTRGLSIGNDLALDRPRALYFLNIVRISPDAAFSPTWTAYVIFIVVIGGIGTIEGPIVGTLIYFFLRWALADYGSAYLILLGVVAIVAMLRFPDGLWGFVQKSYDLRFFPVQRRVKLTN